LDPSVFVSRKELTRNAVLQLKDNSCTNIKSKLSATHLRSLPLVHFHMLALPSSRDTC